MSTKRTSETMANLIESDCQQPLSKRPRVGKSIDEIKTVPSSDQALVNLLSKVAESLVEVSDDDSYCASDASQTSTKKPLLPVPSHLQPLPSKLSNTSKVMARINTSANYCRSGKPLASHPILLRKELQAKFPLKNEIDSTLL
jgi:hypothetical protein